MAAKTPALRAPRPAYRDGRARPLVSGARWRLADPVHRHVDRHHQRAHAGIGPAPPRPRSGVDAASFARLRPDLEPDMLGRELRRYPRPRPLLALDGRKGTSEAGARRPPARQLVGARMAPPPRGRPRPVGKMRRPCAASATQQFGWTRSALRRHRRAVARPTPKTGSGGSGCGRIPRSPRRPPPSMKSREAGSTRISAPTPVPSTAGIL